MSLHPGFVVLVHIKGLIFGIEKVDVGVPAVVVGETDVIPLAINRFDRCWSPQVRMDFLPNYYGSFLISYFNYRLPLPFCPFARLANCSFTTHIQFHSLYKSFLLK